ncbi:hypothetical protein [Nocardia sp. bgisy118]|uniref:hypothetical protein n=1 Tax=Nocardia sp. bgisy118 TaxID=3413786 RepID=UPI003F4A3E6F
MSEISGDAHRARRRAVRSAGPPVEGADAVTEESATDAARLGGEETAGRVKAAESVGRTADAEAAGQAKAGESAGQAKAAESADRPKPADSAERAKDADSAEQAKDVDTAELAKDADSAGPAKDAESAGQAKNADSAVKGADSAGQAKIAEIAEAVENADTVALTKGEPKDSGAADPVQVSAGVESAGAPSADLGKAEAETATSSDETSGSTDGDDTAEGLRGDRSVVGSIVAVAVAAVLVLSLVGGAVASVFVARAAGERDERRTAYVQTARQAILNLTTIRADSAKEDIDRILSMASGQFKTEFDGRVDPFLSIVQQAKVVSNGEIVEAALESDADDSAKVLVAAKQTLTNAGQAEPQTRFYRFRVTVTRTDSGLSASNVEFVA